MINDFLRESLTVYWTTKDITTLIIEIDNFKESEMFFEKGTFIIPFTGNNTYDTKITSIIFDYNQSSEILTEEILTIPIYLLIEQINIQSYPLSEIKLAQHKSPITSGEICILEISRECGFLSYNLLMDTILAEELNNNEYNVLTHVGFAPQYATFYKSALFHTCYAGLIYRETQAVRKFVSNGGGYIGSCYGANMASTGNKFGPITIHLKRVAYYPKIPSFCCYGLADYICINPEKILKYTQVKILNETHPVAYNLDKYIWDYHYGGSQIVPIDKNIQIIANYENSGTNLDNTPSWISSNFGMGRIVTFGTHPEIMAFYKTNKSHLGKTIISNSLFYTTAKDIIDLQIIYSRSLTFIEDIYNKTVDIQINIDPEKVDPSSEYKKYVKAQ